MIYLWTDNYRKEKVKLCMLLFLHKMMLCLSLLSFVLSGVHVLLMLFVFIYWYATRFPFQMMFMSFNSNTTGGSSPPVFSGFVFSV
jgi:hypothetical protein